MLEFGRQRAQRRTAAKPGQREVNEKIVNSGKAHPIPTLFSGDSPNNPERVSRGAKLVLEGCELNELLAARQPPALFNEHDQRPKQILMASEGDPRAWRERSTHPPQQEGLLVRRFPKDIEDARSSRHGGSFKRGLHKLTERCLREEPLEGPL